MSTTQPPDKIDSLPLDLFDEQVTAPPAPASVAEAPDPAWAAAGVGAETPATDDLPRRLRRTYDLVGFVALWLVLTLAFGGVLLRPRLVAILFLAAVIYFPLMRRGANRRRFHGFLNRFRTWVTQQ